MTARFLKDGYPVNVDDTFADEDISISAGGTIEVVNSLASGVSDLIYPDDNTTDPNTSVQ